MDKNYFQEIIQKYEFISALYVTDNEGALLVSSFSNKSIFDGEKETSEKNLVTLKSTLSFIFNSSIEQIARIEKWKTRYITTIFDTFTIFQTKISKTLFCHFICDTKIFNYNILKDVSSDIQNKFRVVEKDLDNLNTNMEINV